MHIAGSEKAMGSVALLLHCSGVPSRKEYRLVQLEVRSTVGEDDAKPRNPVYNQERPHHPNLVMV